MCRGGVGPPGWSSASPKVILPARSVPVWLVALTLSVGLVGLSLKPIGNMLMQPQLNGGTLSGRKRGNPVVRHDIEVSVDYHQFYLWDRGVEPTAPEDYDDDDVKRLVKVAPNVVVIQPIRNFTVPVELEVHDSDPGFNAAEWDHVAECSLDLPTGQLDVEECTGGTAFSTALTPGTYRIRALFSGLDSLSEDGFEGADRYRIVLWPGRSAPLSILKQWPGPR
jgi:hypothetical protein